MGTDRLGFENLDQEYQKDVDKLKASFDQELQQKLMESELDTVGTAEMKQRAIEAVKKNFWLNNTWQLEQKKRELEQAHFAELGGREKAKKEMEAYEMERKRAALREKIREEKGKAKVQLREKAPANQNEVEKTQAELHIKEKSQPQGKTETKVISLQDKKVEFQRQALREQFKQSSKDRGIEPFLD